MTPLDILISITIVVVLLISFASAQGINSLPPSPSPAPAIVNLTDLLSFAGPFHTFLSYSIQTQVIETFQNQANNTRQGITLFVPTDASFSSLKNPSFSNLTLDHLKSIILFHGLPHYYSLADFKDLSNSNPVGTFAGGQYTLNVTYASGVVHVGSDWSEPKIASSVYSTYPAAVYEINKVLLPDVIFGAAPPLPPAPAPTPDIAPASDLAPEPSGSTSKPLGSSRKSNSARSGKINFMGCFAMFASSVLALIV